MALSHRPTARPRNRSGTRSGADSNSVRELHAIQKGVGLNPISLLRPLQPCSIEEILRVRGMAALAAAGARCGGILVQSDFGKRIPCASRGAVLGGSAVDLRQTDAWVEEAVASILGRDEVVRDRREREQVWRRRVVARAALRIALGRALDLPA